MKSIWRLRQLGASILLVCGILISVQTRAQSLELRAQIKINSVVSGNNNSGSPTVSSNGQFVLFVSSATNLVANHLAGREADIYLRDRLSGTTKLISAAATGTEGANARNGNGDLSEDGAWVVFDSYASNLVPGDTNNLSDVFLRSTASGVTFLVSRQAGGANSANGDSRDPVISADGRFIAYQSTATNLAPNDPAPQSDIYLYDRNGGTNILISTGQGSSEKPVISADGRFVAFTTSGTNLISHVSTTPSVFREVYVYDRVDGKLSWASSNILDLAKTFGTVSAMDSFQPAFSADGKFLAFQSWNGGNPSLFLTVRYEVQTAAAFVIQKDSGSGAIWQSGEADGPKLSADGRFLLYSMSSNLFQWDANGPVTKVVSLNQAGGLLSFASFLATSMSGDGRYISFLSDGINLASSSPTGTFQIYLRDMVQGSTSLVSTNRRGDALADVQAAYPILSADGRLLVFETANDDVTSADGNAVWDAFIRDNQSGAAELVSTAIAPSVARSVHLSWPSIPGLSYRVQFNNDLSTTNWTMLNGPVTANSALTDQTDAAGPNAKRFYRITQP